MNRSAWLVGVVVSLAAWPGCAHAQSSDLQGTYVLVADKSADIDAAIDAAVAGMNFIKRPIARSRLKKTNTAYQRIAIARTPNEIEVKFDARAPVRMPANGSAVKWTREDGEVFDVSATGKDTQLVQTYKAEDGTRVNTYRLSEDGRTLDLDVVVSSEQLPTPVKYTVVYRRESSR